MSYFHPHSPALRVVFAFCVSISLAQLACGGDDTPSSDAGDSGGALDPTADAGQNGAGQADAAQMGSDRDAAPDSAGTSKDSGSGMSPDAGQTPDSGSEKPKFSFFMTSQAGLAKLAGKADGFGGDLRFGKTDGLSGADEICRQLAEVSAPGNGKTWKAFLSVTKGPGGTPVNAIDRIGAGPWYDRRGHVFALTKAALLNARPSGADPTIVNDFPNEEGVPNHNPGTGIVDNHNVLTGSTTMGTTDTRGLPATCQDWTSSEAAGGKPRCGVSWPRGQLTHWISTLDEGGCAPGATPPGAESGTRGTVGALGGYGGFYCFALTP